MRLTIVIRAYPVVMIPDSTVSDPIWASYKTAKRPKSKKHAWACKKAKGQRGHVQAAEKEER